MSREFGSYCNGYFSEQIDYAASDCMDGSREITKLWGKFLREFYPIAYAIASAEACDSGVDYPINETMSQMKKIEESLEKIKQYVEPFKSVADAAVRKYVEEQP